VEGGAWGLVGRSSKCQAHGGKTNLNVTDLPEKIAYPFGHLQTLQLWSPHL
jgi:hypothetical protein